jgi:hypothetical protein
MFMVENVWAVDVVVAKVKDGTSETKKDTQRCIWDLMILQTFSKVAP